MALGNIAVIAVHGRRGKGYNAMRKGFRELFGQWRGERSAIRVIEKCIEDDTAAWSDRLKAIAFAAQYGFGQPERLDDEQIILVAEKKLEQRIAEARAALGPMDVMPVSRGDAE